MLRKQLNFVVLSWEISNIRGICTSGVSALCDYLLRLVKLNSSSYNRLRGNRIQNKSIGNLVLNTICIYYLSLICLSWASLAVLFSIIHIILVTVHVFMSNIMTTTTEYFIRHNGSLPERYTLPINTSDQTKQPKNTKVGTNATNIYTQLVSTVINTHRSQGCIWRGRGVWPPRKR